MKTTCTIVLLFSLSLVVFALSACSALSAPAPIQTPTRRPTVTPFPVIEMDTVLYPTQDPLSELTVVLPTSEPVDVEEIFPLEVLEIDCVPSMPDGWIWYEVEPGDTLENLAQRSSVTVDELIEVNCLEENLRLAAHALMFVPEH